MKRKCVHLYSLILLIGSIQASQLDFFPDDCQTDFNLSSDYNKHEIPIPKSKETVHLWTKLDILDIQVLDESIQVLMKIQLSLRWIDERIKLPRKSRRLLPLTIRQRQLIWMPNFVTTFRKKISAEDFVQHSDFVTLKPNHLNQTEVQLQIVLSWGEPCPKMNFKNYPFDKHVCHFGFRSLEFSETQMRLISDCIRYGEDEQSPKHYDIEVFARKSNKTDVNGIAHSIVGFEVRLQRIVSALLISHYIPVTLFTLASFTSFSMSLNRGNDRIGFLVTLFLVLVSMNISITNTSPGGNMITSVEWYSFVCMMFCFVALLEYGVLLALLRHSSPQSFRRKGSNFSRSRSNKDGEKLCSKIDKIFANWVIFFFVLFWLTYFFMSASQYYL